MKKKTYNPYTFSTKYPNVGVDKALLILSQHSVTMTILTEESAWNKLAINILNQMDTGRVNSMLIFAYLGYKIN